MAKPLSPSRITFSKLLRNYRPSQIAQSVKNPPAMQETWVQSLGWEDPLEKGKATHSSILAWRISWTLYIVHGIAKSQTGLSDFHFTNYHLMINMQFLAL